MKCLFKAREIISLISKAEDSTIRKSAYELLKVRREGFLERQKSCRETHVTFAVTHSFVSIFKAHSIMFNCSGPL